MSKAFIFQRLTRSPGRMQETDQSSTGQNVVSRKTCVSESATGQMISEDTAWTEVEGLFPIIRFG